MPTSEADDHDYEPPQPPPLHLFHTIDLFSGRCEPTNTPLNSFEPRTAYHPLVILHLPATTDPVIHVKVQLKPSRDHQNNKAWIVASRPSSQLAVSARIVLHTNSESSGIGRLASINGFYRHWISFAIQGGEEWCSLRVPVPWTKLGPEAYHTHSSAYTTLPERPTPHPDFIGDPYITRAATSPYEFDFDEEVATTPIRLNASPSLPQPNVQTKHRSHRRRRALATSALFTSSPLRNASWPHKPSTSSRKHSLSFITNPPTAQTPTHNM
ncbi:hypothetical protein EVJ58_g9866 [Rhodofomes roseus]|uniref:Uncharacterized protein n=1 Tax=Rhodofomes roseus TaxID=34475 RepID=A0A4Y9XU90_9APHY|nr:hypothetical protein EVJ58_g9866 [Rhodofomes roseus]